MSIQLSYLPDYQYPVERQLMAESASTCSSKFLTNTQTSTVRNESVNCRWILQGGEHNLLRFTDSNRPIPADGVKTDDRPFSSIAGIPHGVAKPKFNQSLHSVKRVQNTRKRHSRMHDELVPRPKPVSAHVVFWQSSPVADFAFRGVRIRSTTKSRRD